jgi:ribonuclease VapC
MVIDASALVTILLREPEWDRFLDAILTAGGGVISPVNAWETCVRTAHLRDETGRPDAERLMAELGSRSPPSTPSKPRSPSKPDFASDEWS